MNYKQFCLTLEMLIVTTFIFEHLIKQSPTQPFYSNRMLCHRLNIIHFLLSHFTDVTRIKRSFECDHIRIPYSNFMGGGCCVSGMSRSLH